MPNYVSNNPGAMNARRYLDINNQQLAKHQNELSSGSKISDPTNNPATSAIGILIQSDIQTLAQASNNAIQGSSLVQLGVGALTSTNETLTRMQTIAAQSNSSTMGPSERQMFMAEFSSLLAQINNNAKVEWRQTELFNGGNGLVANTGATGIYNTAAAANDSSTALATPNGGANSVGTIHEMLGSISANNATAIGNNATHTFFNIGTEQYTFNVSSGALADGDVITFVSSSDSNKKIRINITDTIAANAAGANELANGIQNLFSAADYTDGDFQISQNATGLTSVSNWFTGGLNLANSAGLYTGTATEAIVTQSSGSSTYDVRMTIGDQVFRAAAAASPSAGGTLVLTSQNDPENKIAFNYDLSSVVSNPSAENFQSALQNLLGLQKNAPISGRAAFSANTAPAYPGATVAVDTNGVSGTYGLTYTTDGTTATFRLTDGKNPPLTSAIAESSISSGSVIDFGNGVKINITDSALFKADSSKGFTTFSVDNGVTMSFQVGGRTTNTLTVNFAAANTTALDLDGISVLSVSGAADAATKISTAINTVNQQIAQLGGKKSQLEFIIRNLDISQQNLIAAKATFTDTDIPTALMEVQKYEALADISASMLQKTMEKDKKLSRLVQQATSG